MMNKIKILLLLIFSVAILSCEDEKIEDVYRDYRFETKVIPIEQDFRSTCINAALDFSVLIEKHDPRINDYNFSYTLTKGEGVLFYNDTILPAGQTVNCRDFELPLRFIPTSKGEFRLKFNFQNDLVNVSDQLSGNANKSFFSIKAKNLPSKLLIDKPFLFDLELTTPDGQVNKFKTNTTVTEGGGQITIINRETLSDSTGTTAFLFTGNNKVSYVSKNPGQNTLNFNVLNQYGFTQLMSLTLNIELPDFDTKILCDTIVATGTNSFLLQVNDIDRHGNNQYFTTYRWLENAGKLKINDSEINTGSILEIKPSDNVCQFTPTAIGNARLEFLVRDKYNTVRKDTAIFDVIKATTDITVSNYMGQGTVSDLQFFNFAVYRKNYSGKYQFEIISDKAIDLTVNGVKYSGGRQVLTNHDNTQVTFIPKEVGTTKLALRIYDDYNSLSLKELSFEISNSNGRINISNHNPAINILSTTSFNFSVTKPNYSKGFKFEIIKNPVQCGDLKINGKDYSGGKVVLENPDNTIISYTPTILGDVILSICVYDDFGGKITKDIPFAVGNTTINLSVNSLEKELIVAKETFFNFTADKQFFNGDLNYSLEIVPTDAGTLKVNGESYIPNFTKGKIPNRSTTAISFCPVKEGNVALTISTWDDYMGVKRYPVNFTVTNPSIHMEVTNFSDKAIVHTESKFNFSLTKQNYSGKYKYQIEILPAQAGQIKVNDAVYEGKESELPSGGSNNICFTPNQKGKVKLQITVTDELKGEIKKEFVFNVENPDLQVILANVDDDLILNKRSTFNFSINKPGYQGKFFYEIIGENCTDIKVANVIYTIGERNEVQSPQGTSVSFVPSIVGNDTVQLSMRFFDGWGGYLEKKLSFSVSNSDIELIVNHESQVYVNKKSVLTLEANKPNYKEKLKYEIAATPNNGTFLINGENYTSGWREFEPGKPVVVSYLPTNAGVADVKVTVADQFGGQKSKSFTYNIKNPELKTEISNFITAAILKTENIFNVSVKKEFYSGAFFCDLATEPLQPGLFKIDGQPYDGGRIELKNPENTRIGFTPTKTGDVTLNLTISDQTGLSVKRQLIYRVSDNPIRILVSNQETGLTIDQPSSFNFSVSKSGYQGKFHYEITAEPTVAGVIKVNDVIYQGGMTPLSNTTNTKVTFTPSVTGEVNLTLRIYDENENKESKQLHFSVRNSDFNIITSNLEKDILLGKQTSFNLSCIKKNYTGTYKYEIETTPSNVGNILVNGSAYVSGKQTLTHPVNSIIQFTSLTPGINSLLIRVFDENGGSSQEVVTFNCINPPIEVNITGKGEKVFINVESPFNVSVNKNYYTDKFKIQLISSPANSASIKINNISYNGGTQTIDDPQNCRITLIPKIEGNIVLQLIITDNVNGKSEQTLNFNVINSEIDLSVSNHTSDIVVHAPTTFNFAVAKTNYPGQFMYQITQEPASAGTLEVNNIQYNGYKQVVDTPYGNIVKFTPRITGVATLYLNITDDWGKSKSESIVYSISNSDIKVNVSGRENSLFRNKPTSFSFSIIKPNYTGNFEAEIIQEPVSIGKLKMNGTAYTSGLIPIKSTNNLVEFVPEKTGSTLLKLRIKDELNGEKEVVLNFDVSDPPITLDVNNRTTDINVGSTIKFTIKADKENYDGNFNYEITPYPYSGSVSVGGKVGLTGTIDKTVTEITYTPESPGSVALKIKISDTWGGIIEKQVNFNVKNPPININITDAEENIIINQPTTFSFAINKVDYPDNKDIYYSVSPANRGTLTVDGKPYTGGSQQIKYSQAKKGVVVTYSPDRSGNSELAITVADEYNQSKQALVNFNVSNPELNLTITGANESGNTVNLNETYKFFFNVDKQYYNDDFAYWITTDPADVAMVATSDVTPRSRTADGSGSVTGTIKSSSFGTSTAEVRFTPNNPDYLNSPINVSIRVRDKWNYERTKVVKFTPTTSAIMVDVVRQNTSIAVTKPYLFHFIVSKPGYTDKFKYTIIGANESDKLEVGSDAARLTDYNGGKFDVPDINHTYIRYTPNSVGTSPLKLFIYDVNNVYAEKDITFDVKVPEVTLTGGGVKYGETDKYIPFTLVAKDENVEDMNINFKVDQEFDGVVLFNKTDVTSNTRSVPVKISSGVNNTLEVMSRKVGEYSTDVSVTNRWNGLASSKATVSVNKPIHFTLGTQVYEGQGTIQIINEKEEYSRGDIVELIAKPAPGYRFKDWWGSLSGTAERQKIIMDSNKFIYANFERIPKITANVNVKCKVSGRSDNLLDGWVSFEVIIKESNTGAVVYNKKVQGNNYAPNEQIEIDRTLDYDITINTNAPQILLGGGSGGTRYQLVSKSLQTSFANGTVYSSNQLKVKGEAFTGSQSVNNFLFNVIYQLEYK